MLQNKQTEESTNTNWQTLDTLKFENNKIFLKQQHIQRTIDTFNFLKDTTYPQISVSKFMLNYFLKNISSQFLNLVIYNTQSFFQNSTTIYNHLFNDNSNTLSIETLITAIYDELENRYSSHLNSKQCLKIKFNPFKIEINLIPQLPKVISLKLFLNEAPNQADAHHSEIVISPSLVKENFKWSQRDFWNRLLTNKPQSINDFLIINNHGFVTETCFFNVFLFDKKNLLIYTPSLNTGCLNGVFRRSLLKDRIIEIDGFGNLPIIEKNILGSDIQNYIVYVGNSLRGLLPTRIY